MAGYYPAIVPVVTCKTDFPGGRSSPTPSLTLSNKGEEKDVEKRGKSQRGKFLFALPSSTAYPASNIKNGQTLFSFIFMGMNRFNGEMWLITISRKLQSHDTRVYQHIKARKVVLSHKISIRRLWAY